MGNAVPPALCEQSERIERVHASELSREDFIQRYFYTNTPVIIQGGTQPWRAASWNLDNLSQYLPDREVDVRNNESGVLFDPNTMAYRSTRVSLHRFLHQLRAHDHATPMYVAQTNLASLLDAPEHYVGRFAYLRATDYLLQTNIWIGTPGLATPCHFDFAHNFYHQVAGHKQITLFSQQDNGNLYQNPKLPCISLVNVGAPDLVQFPRFQQAEPMSFVVSPGDSVFIPAGWWHYIASMYDNNISLNQWYLRPWSRNTRQLALLPPLLSNLLPKKGKRSA